MFSFSSIFPIRHKLEPNQADSVFGPYELGDSARADVLFPNPAVEFPLPEMPGDNPCMA
jgi:hypothetical protein